MEKPSFQIVKNDINSFISFGMKTAIVFNPKIGGDFFGNPATISSRHFDVASEDDYLKEHGNIHDNSCFLFELSDGASIQIFYEFKKKYRKKMYLSKMNLAYLPPVDEDTGKIRNEYIRADYDSEVNNSFFHPDVHLHIGFSNSIRIPLNHLFTLSDFCHLIFYLFYNDHYLKMVEKTSAISHTFSSGEKDVLSNCHVISTELLDKCYLKVNFTGRD